MEIYWSHKFYKHTTHLFTQQSPAKPVRYGKPCDKVTAYLCVYLLCTCTCTWLRCYVQPACASKLMDVCERKSSQSHVTKTTVQMNVMYNKTILTERYTVVHTKGSELCSKIICLQHVKYNFHLPLSTPWRSGLRGEWHIQKNVSWVNIYSHASYLHNIHPEDANVNIAVYIMFLWHYTNSELKWDAQCCQLISLYQYYMFT